MLANYATVCSDPNRFRLDAVPVARRRESAHSPGRGKEGTHEVELAVTRQLLLISPVILCSRQTPKSGVASLWSAVAPAMLPKAIRSFHIPKGAPMFASGNLAVHGLLSGLFGSSPVPTVVRTKRRGDRIDWLRSFRGGIFGSSEWKFSDPYRHTRGDPADAIGYRAWKHPPGTRNTEIPDIHDIESVLGVDFHFHWEVASDNTVLPRHTHTTIWGLVLPRQLVCVDLSMKPHADDGGWDLSMKAHAMNGAFLIVGYEGSMRLVDTIRTKYVEGFHDLVMFDGRCSLCNASVDFLMRNDSLERFVFCPQQHPAALVAVETAHPHAIDMVKNVGSETDRDSVLVLGANGQLYHHSDAALRALQVIGGPLGWAAALAALLPRWLRDSVYNMVGRNRYKVFGKKDTCRLPTPAERMRFL